MASKRRGGDLGEVGDWWGESLALGFLRGGVFGKWNEATARL